ncbi:MAG: photosynthetic complex assembly protein PuhC [Aestuariivirga sp.]|uniref:photosynthetic complex assembly protein PuhC n=1 Tax=Aestuariivirga sp. TaxID=2650926 RepID=UPI0038D058F4
MTNVRAPVPLTKLPLAVAFGIAALAFIAVAGARLSGFTPQPAVTEAQIVQSRLIRFEASEAGEIKVLDAKTGAVIANAGREGFVPGVLRGLNRIRRNAEADLAHAWRLEKLENGQVMLTDTATGVSLDLNAYGHANARVFDNFLVARGDNS